MSAASAYASDTSAVALAPVATAAAAPAYAPPASAYPPPYPPQGMAPPVQPPPPLNVPQHHQHMVPYGAGAPQQQMMAMGYPPQQQMMIPSPTHVGPPSPMMGYGHGMSNGMGSHYHHNQMMVMPSAPLAQSLHGPGVKADGTTVAMDSQGRMVEGALKVSDAQQAAYDAVEGHKAQLELLRLQKQTEAEAQQVDPAKRLELEIEFDERELAELNKKMQRKQCLCVFGWLLLCPLYCFIANSQTIERTRLEHIIMDKKARLAQHQKELYLIKNSATYTRKIETVNPFAKNGAGNVTYVSTAVHS